MPHQWKHTSSSISSGLQKPCSIELGLACAMLIVHAAATHMYHGSTVKARVRKELSEVGLVATPDQPTSRKPDFAGGPWFLLILFCSPFCLACFFHVASPDSSPASSAKLCFGSCLLPPPLPLPPEVGLCILFSSSASSFLAVAVSASAYASSFSFVSTTPLFWVPCLPAFYVSVTVLSFLFHISHCHLWGKPVLVYIIDYFPDARSRQGF